MKRTKKSINTQKGKCCECQYATWQDVHWNRDIYGVPITVRCPFYEDGKYGIIRDTPACSKFIKKNDKDPYCNHDS